MSRTKRSVPKGKRLVVDADGRDGADIRISRSCKNHGSCKHCESTRTHATLRRMTIAGPLKLETGE